MKQSIYNYLVADRDGRQILYNSITGKMTVFNMGYRDILKNALYTQSVSNELEAYLYENKYIIDSKIDEKKVVFDIAKSILEKEQLFLMILPTMNCNFMCKYCYEVKEPIMMNEKTTNQIIDFVEGQISNYKSLHVEWYGGEPLLCRKTINHLSNKLIDICKKNRKVYISMMTTNGYDLTPDCFLDMEKCRIVGYQISIDGLAATHNKQRFLINKGPTWDRIISNLRWIRDNYKSQMIHVMIRTNITREIYDDLDNYFEFLHKEFGNDKRFSFFIHLAQDWGNIQDTSIKNSFCDTNDFYIALEKMAEFGLRTHLYYNFLQPGARICYAAKRNFYMIMPNGYIGQCSGYLYEKNNFFSTTERFDPHPYDWDLVSTLPEPCTNCKNLPLCFGQVCPHFKGDIQKTCGYELSDMDRYIRIVARTDDRVIHYGEV